MNGTNHKANAVQCKCIKCSQLLDQGNEVVCENDKCINLDSIKSSKRGRFGINKSLVTSSHLRFFLDDKSQVWLFRDPMSNRITVEIDQEEGEHLIQLLQIKIDELNARINKIRNAMTASNDGSPLERLTKRGEARETIIHLLSLSPKGETISELAKKTGVSYARVHSLLTTKLVDKVQKDADTGRFILRDESSIKTPFTGFIEQSEV